MRTNVSQPVPAIRVSATENTNKIVQSMSTTATHHVSGGRWGILLVLRYPSGFTCPSLFSFLIVFDLLGLANF